VKKDIPNHNNPLNLPLPPIPPIPPSKRRRKCNETPAKEIEKGY
jgi:hypothetical protein